MSDEDVLERMSLLSMDSLVELVMLYQRLDNQKMVEALTAEINRRNPTGAPPFTFPSTEDFAGGIQEPDDPYDAFENRLELLMNSKRYDEAIQELEDLKKRDFNGVPFRFEPDLADAYAESGQTETAKALYESIAGNAAFPKTEQDAAQKWLEDFARNEKIKEAYANLALRRHKEALALAGNLRQTNPGQPEVELLYAECLSANGRYGEALPLLEKLRADPVYQGQPFTGEFELAESLRAAGRLEDAQAAYGRGLAQTGLTPQEIKDARSGAMEVYRQLADWASASSEVLDEDEGTMVATSFEAWNKVSDKVHVGVRSYFDHVDLNKGGVIDRKSASNAYGDALFRYSLPDQHYLKAWVGGGSGDDVRIGAQAGKDRLHSSKWRYSLSYAANERAIDSQQLVAIQGSEDRVQADAAGMVAGKYEVSANAYGRSVSAQGVDLGNGFGGELDISRVVRKSVTETFVTKVGYRLDYSQFDADRLNAEDLDRLGFIGDDPAEGRLLGETFIDPTYHQQGFYIDLGFDVTEKLFAYANAGLFYDFESEGLEYQLSAGLLYDFSQRAALELGGAYYSNGTGASSDSSVLIGSVGLRVFY